VVRFKKKEVGNRQIPHMGMEYVDGKNKSKKKPLKDFKTQSSFILCTLIFLFPKTKR